MELIPFILDLIPTLSCSLLTGSVFCVTYSIPFTVSSVRNSFAFWLLKGFTTVEGGGGIVVANGRFCGQLVVNVGLAVM